jgi:hypothetical protein
MQFGAGAASWQGASGVGGAYYKTAVGLVVRKHDNSEIPLNAVPTTVYSNAVPVSSVTTGEIDAQSYTMPANTMNADGQRLQLTLGFGHGANTNTATLRVYMIGTIIVNQARAVSGELEMGSIIAVRASSSTLRWQSNVVVGSGTANSTGVITTDFTVPNIFKLTVEGPTLAGDMVARFLRVEFWP